MRVLILIVALLWGGASWWWYTCNIKGYCDGDTNQIESKKEESKPSEEHVAEAASATAEDVAKVNDVESHSSDEAKGENPSSNAAADDKADSASVENPDSVISDANKTENADATSDNTSTNAEAQSEELATGSDAEQNTDTESQDVTTDDTSKPISTADDIAQSADNNDPKKIRIDLVSSASGASVAEGEIEKVRIYFPYNSSGQSNLSSSAVNYFDKVVAALNADDAMKITLTGHTDSQGNDKRNKTLGLRRAEVVKKMLVEKGAPASRIETSSKGEKSPIATNKTEAGRTKNRRVELEPTT